MHRSWNVPEVTRMIFEQLGSSYPGNTAAIALYQLASTCRRFSDPALDLLWQTQYGIIPLLKCLPSNVWEASVGSFVIRSSIEAADWDRVFTYSKRIKTLHEDEKPMDTSVMECILMSLPTDSLIPSIQSLSFEIVEIDSTLFPYLRFLIGPHLTSVYIPLDYPLRRLSPLSLLGSKCPILKDVVLRDQGYFDDDDNITPISSFIRTLDHIETLHVPALNQSAYHHLARLLTLKSLDIGFVPAEAFPDDAHHLLPDSSFPALQHLGLHTLSIIARGFLTEINSAALFSVFQSQCSFSNLRSISINLDEGEPLQMHMPMYTRTSAILRPLLALINLRHVLISSLPKFILDDAFVDAMALAWPHIKSLSIRGMSYGHCGLSPPALFSLARSFPALRNLTLDVDFTRVHKPASQPAQATQTALVYADFADSPIGSPVETAGLLSSISPALSRVEGVHDEKWAEVERLVPMFAAIRADEQEAEYEPFKTRSIIIPCTEVNALAINFRIFNGAYSKRDTLAAALKSLMPPAKSRARNMLHIIQIRNWNEDILQPLLVYTSTRDHLCPNCAIRSIVDVLFTLSNSLTSTSHLDPTITSVVNLS
ncbi:hypothetical protein C8R44DRAFT_984764 [Mycena epipterygia]|nr:hypothetical protein C8R44DRAFT_984764 [Mycena epipterygia]